MISIYSIPTFIGSIFAISIGIVVLIKSKRYPIKLPFFLFCFSIFSWLFAYTIAYSTKNFKLAIFSCNLACTAVIFTAPTAYHFIVNYLQLTKKRKTVYIPYIIMVIFAFLFLFTKYFLDTPVRHFWGYYSKAGPLHPIYIGVHVTIVGVALFLLYKSLMNKSLSPNERLRIKYMFWFYLIAAFSGIDFMQKYKGEFYPFGFLFVLIFLFIAAYAIVRHQLLEIEVIIKKSLVFAGMFAFVFGVVVVVAMLVAQVLGGANNLLALVVSALIITFSLRPLENWLINATDKFLFQKKYEYKQIIKTFIDEVVTLLNLDEVVNSTLKLLDQTLHPYTCAVFILNKAEDKYQLYQAFGLESKNISFTSESKLVNFLKKTQQPAIIRQINGIAGVAPEIQEEMSQIQAVLVLPLLLHNDLIGFITLGKKKSDEEYTKDDLDVLLDLVRTESIAIGNAQLLTEAAQAERRAAIGTMAAGIHHEIGNPLNIINTKIQVFLTGIQRGVYQGKTKEEIIAECQNILNETLNQTNRIAEITRKLANFAKPSQEFKPQVLNLSEEIEETLEILGHELELERIKIVKEFSQDALKVLADKREMQQIFFNLIRNAAQAIEDKGIVTIRTKSDNEKIRIEIEDTGRGIPEDKQTKIFEPFFTTKGSRGTGLGLSIVRQLVWRNKGEISFKSQLGRGTTFILDFPQVKG